MPQWLSSVLPLPGRAVGDDRLPSPREHSTRNSTRSLRTSGDRRREAGVALERVQAGGLLGGQHRRDGVAGRLSRRSVGIDQVRSDPPCVGSSSTSTTVSPAAASTRWVVSSER